MAECAFCELVHNKLYFKVYEDRYFLGFLDNTPLSEGHTLVIPKKHFNNVWEMPAKGDYNIGDFFIVCKKISNTLQFTLGPKEPVYGLVMGYQVPHASVHLIPKVYSGFALTLGSFLTTRKSKKIMDSDDMFNVIKKIGKIPQ
ncbi:MAG: HIT domain-containing protein [Candidatus Dojkabacteria bacterium]